MGELTEPVENLPEYDFRIQGEDIIHHRYVTVYNRKVQLPPTLDGKVGALLTLKPNVNVAYKHT